MEELNRLIGKRDHLEFLNAKNEVYRELNMKLNPPDREEALRLMAAHPNLIRRPLFVEGGKVLFGFKPEEWSEIG